MYFHLICECKTEVFTVHSLNIYLSIYGREKHQIAEIPIPLIKPNHLSSLWTLLWNYLQNTWLNSFKNIPVIVLLTSNDQYVVWLLNFEPWLVVTSILLPRNVDFSTKWLSRRNSPSSGTRPPHSGFCLAPFQS